jgi:hypothetical protein
VRRARSPGGAPVAALRSGAAACALVVCAAGPARAGEPGGDRVPVPEPLLTETVTDIDGSDAGEIEIEANGSVMRALRGGASALDASIEVEWLVVRKLGLRVEPSISRDADGAAVVAGGVSGGVSWKLLQDFARRLHVDVEALGRAPWEDATLAQPGDPALPAALDVRAAWQPAWLTLRASAGVGAFGHAEHAPLRGSLALLAPFEGSGRFGFWGVELDADGARAAPVVVALNVVPNFTPAGLPLRVGLALPWSVGERDDRPSVGVFLRVFYESAREIAFASSSSAR